jgi:hypothetical protein
MEQLDPDRDVSKFPLFNVFMVVNNAEFEYGTLGLEKMNISDYPHRTEYHTSKFDLSFLMSEKEDGIFCRHRIQLRPVRARYCRTYGRQYPNTCGPCRR